MQLQVIISLDNSSFDERMAEEIAYVLSQVTKNCIVQDRRILMDTNGNRVGTATISDGHFQVGNYGK